MYRCLAYMYLEVTQQVQAFLPLYPENNELFNKAFAALTTTENTILTLTFHVGNSKKRDIIIALISMLLNYVKQLIITLAYKANNDNDTLEFGECLFAYYAVQFNSDSTLYGIQLLLKS